MTPKQYPSLGCCSLDCGMCPAYYTDGPSQCPGCGGEYFFEKHPSCFFITCWLLAPIVQAARLGLALT